MKSHDRTRPRSRDFGKKQTRSRRPNRARSTVGARVTFVESRLDDEDTTRDPDRMIRSESSSNRDVDAVGATRRFDDAVGATRRFDDATIRRRRRDDWTTHSSARASFGRSNITRARARAKGDATGRARVENHDGSRVQTHRESHAG